MSRAGLTAAQREVPAEQRDHPIHDLLARFEAVARLDEPPPICWISFGDDAGADYCPDCVEKRALQIQGEGYPDAITDGGWDAARSSDGTAYCEMCETPLGYSLTEYGLTDEIYHWLDDPCEPPLRPCDAYNIAAILDAAKWSEDGELVANAIRIAEQNVDGLPDLNAGRTALAATDADRQGENT